METYYELLGVTRNATAIEVKAAFQRQMKALEASAVQGERQQTREKMLQQAFLTLLDVGRRARYDKQLETPSRRVVVEPVEAKGVSVVTVTFVAALLVAIVAGGWYMKHQSAKQEAARKEEEARAKAAPVRLQYSPPKAKPDAQPVKK
jgi:curved DNA-binding protein CbpA